MFITDHTHLSLYLLRIFSDTPQLIFSYFSSYPFVQSDLFVFDSITAIFYRMDQKNGKTLFELKLRRDSNMEMRRQSWACFLELHVRPILGSMILPFLLYTNFLFYKAIAYKRVEVARKVIKLFALYSC